MPFPCGCRFKFRLILDETMSFGVLGATGRGLTEYYNVPPAEAELLLGSHETSLASVGGFCVGAREVCASLPAPSVFLMSCLSRLSLCCCVFFFRSLTTSGFLVLATAFLRPHHHSLAAWL
jgi:hypothetical protein